MFGIGGGLLEYWVSLLVGKGFVVMVLVYYNYEDFFKIMEMFYLEYFEEVMNYLFSYFEVKGLGVGLFGIFKGGEFCFFMVFFLKGIMVVVVINGFVVNVGGILCYKGEILFFVGVNRNCIKVIKDGYVDIVDVLNSFLEGFD